MLEFPINDFESIVYGTLMQKDIWPEEIKLEKFVRFE